MTTPSGKNKKSTSITFSFIRVGWAKNWPKTEQNSGEQKKIKTEAKLWDKEKKTNTNNKKHRLHTNLQQQQLPNWNNDTFRFSTTIPNNQTKTASESGCIYNQGNRCDEWDQTSTYTRRAVDTGECDQLISQGEKQADKAVDTCRKCLNISLLLLLTYLLFKTL